MDITNGQLVGAQGDEIVVVLPKLRMSKEEALRHAAWLVSVADPLGVRFHAVLDAVRRGEG